MHKQKQGKNALAKEALLSDKDYYDDDDENLFSYIEGERENEKYTRE